MTDRSPKLSAAQKREQRRRMIEEADRIYYPCSYGVHVCGSDDAKNAAVTVANIPTRDEAAARKVFEACRAEAECRGDDPHDLVVDLNLGRENRHVEDFWLSRQMLERCLTAGRRVRDTT